MTQEEVERAIDRAVNKIISLDGATIDQVIAAMHLKAVELDRGYTPPLVQ